MGVRPWLRKCPCSTVVVHPLGKGEVTSSNLVMGSIYQQRQIRRYNPD